jgi:hypothetical protein
VSEIKLIALDLDDTLLRNDLQISPRAKTAIRSAVERGVAVTLATGRMFASAIPFAQELGLDLPLITYQGALVKYADGRVVYHRPIPLEIARELVDFILPYGYHLNVYLNDELFMQEDSPEGQRYAAIAKVPVHLVSDLRNIIAIEPTKLVIIAKEPQLDALAEDLNLRFGNRINITKSKPYFLELAHPQATKGKALATLAESLNIGAHEVMAVGDSPNDLDMIRYAGFGVAMGNAVEEVKKCARYITRSNDDDGVAEVIEKFVLS